MKTRHALDEWIIIIRSIFLKKSDNDVNIGISLNSSDVSLKYSEAIINPVSISSNNSEVRRIGENIMV